MKTFFTVFLLLLTMGLSAQSYNNEWIDYSKTYYKFKVGASGLYRIPQTVLASAGLGSVPVQQFQLFRNGQEVPIYTSVASGVLGSSDYIEFWGRMNDGAADQPLYRSPTYQHTQKWSLETDTAVYFLTVNSTGTPFHFVSTTNDVSGTTLTVEPYFMHKTGNYFKSAINPGFAQVVGEYIYSSSYDMGEFWASNPINAGSSLTDNQNNLFAYAGGPDATVSFGMVGCADYNRTVKFMLNGSTVLDTAMNSFDDLNTTRSVPISQLSSNTANVQFMDNSTVSVDRMVASYYELNYPRQFNFGGQANFYFELPAKAAGYYLQITNLAVVSGVTPVLYDLTEGHRYDAVVGAGNVLSFVLGGSAYSRRLVLVNEDPSQVKTVTSLTSRTFTNYTMGANQGNYIIVSTPVLYTGTSGNNPVTDYMNYRNSPAGGSFNTHVYDIDELVDQFAFGIKKHPISIYNFLHFARANFAVKPQFVLLMGHGMTYNDYHYYSDSLHDPLAEKLNLIPTFGYPASDNKLAAANVLDGVPATPVGRLSVVTGAEIEIYLRKIKEYELAQATAPNTVDGRLWMKNVLHLTGVSEPFLGTILCNYMYVYKGLIEDSLYGANVSTLCDGNGGQANQGAGGLIAKLFTSGFSMLNYFGHSSNTELGYSLDNPENYDNPGKYPVFFLNGCDAGNFFIYDALRFTSSTTISEKYTLAKGKGAIAVVASTHFGIVNYLNLLLYGLYSLIDQADYGKPLGVIQKDALQKLVLAAPGDYFARLHSEEMTTHGDPYLRLNQGGLPDYDIEAPQVWITPTFVSVSDNSFTMKARFYNLGKTTGDSISVLVTRKFPDGSSMVVLKKRLAGFGYSDSIEIAMPVVATRDKGQNYVTVTINSDNDVTETTLANNSVNASVFVYEDEANPIYPYNYAIINTDRQKVYASTADPLSISQPYVMEMDTTSLFNSASKVTKNLTSTGGVLEFDPGISYLDSVVYYWRVSKVPQAGGSYKWNAFSFVYIDPNHSVSGFNQSHFYQQTESSLQGLVADSTGRHFNFDMISNILSMNCGVFPTSSSTGHDISITINGDGGSVIQSVCGINEVLVSVFSPYTFKPWYNAPTGSPGRYNSMSPCGVTREHYFIYDMGSAASRAALVHFLDTIPDNYYVVVYNCAVDPSFCCSNNYIDSWKADTAVLGSGNSAYHRLYNLGFTGVDSFYKARAWIFAYQKNNPANFAPRWIVSKDVTDKIIMSVHYSTVDTVGMAVSPLFGPAKKWKEIHWRGNSLENPSSDQYTVQVTGIDTTGAKTPLYTLSSTTQDFDISAVDAAKYPYVQLMLRVADTASGTPYQLRYWRVTYDPVPEGALAPNIYLKVKDTLLIGETLDFAVAFKNVSPLAFDSMALKLVITDKNNVAHIIPLPKKKPLLSGDTLTVSYQLDTKGYPGRNTLYLDVNPNNSQPEQYHFNNFVYKNFYVVSENRSPVLDVTFDNIHILNDDIVSAKPHIQIKLQSQSKYALLTDTSLISVQLQYPDGSIHPYHFNTDTMRFTPASPTGDNVAVVDFNPAFLKQYKESGDDYTLIVTGKDQFGNSAGTTPYRVNFKIITKSMISNMLNYPNPFTTSTAFVFTITGSEVPQNIKIQILTITGKIVREITKDELGPLHVGRNITEFKWNGTDEYSQRLANGVYLYHVVTNLNGKSLDKYKAGGDNTDRYFNNGYGKMYLMR